MIFLYTRARNGVRIFPREKERLPYSVTVRRGVFLTHPVPMFYPKFDLNSPFRSPGRGVKVVRFGRFDHGVGGSSRGSVAAASGYGAAFHAVAWAVTGDGFAIVEERCSRTADVNRVSVMWRTMAHQFRRGSTGGCKEEWRSCAAKPCPSGLGPPDQRSIPRREP